MSLTEYEYERNDNYVDELVYTATEGVNDPARKRKKYPYRELTITMNDDEITVGVQVTDLLSGDGLNYDGMVTLEIDNERVTIEANDGTATRIIDTEEPVEVQAVGLKDHPAEPSETVVIEP